LCCPTRAAQGPRHRAQGENNKKKLILSLCLAPYALRPEPLLLAKTWTFAPLNGVFIEKTTITGANHYWSAVNVKQMLIVLLIIKFGFFSLFSIFPLRNEKKYSTLGPYYSPKGLM